MSDSNIKNVLMHELSELLNSFDKNPQKAIFHYTSFEGLSGILKTKQLWLTHHKYLNDPSEILHGKKIILNEIDNNIKNNPELRDFFKNKFCELIDNCYHVFITSFCSKGDYLPAWRYYGNNGAGFSIGFKKNYFLRKNDEIMEGDDLLLFKIEYGDSKKFKKVFDKADNIFPNWAQKTIDELRQLEFLECLSANLLTLLPSVKNIDYIGEHEWRLSMPYLEVSGRSYPTPIPKDRLIICPCELPSNTPFLKNLNTSIPRIKSLKFNYDDIHSIYIGPRLDFITAKSSIEKILLDEGLTPSELKKILIKESERSYQ